jgi:energy-coupling factor transporter transmembrane protein EcfT
VFERDLKGLRIEVRSKNIFGCLMVIADMENAEYSEWVPAGALVKGLFGMVSLIIVFVTFAVFLFGEEPLVENILGVAFAWVILAILLLVFWKYRGLRIQIKDDKLSLDYGVFNKKSFLLKEITSCKKTRAFRRYLGVGVRYGLDGSMAYTTSFANAVEVTPKVGRTFVFSSKNPDRVCEIMTKGMLS